MFSNKLTKSNSSLVHFEYFLPKSSILNEFYFFEDFLWDHISKSNIQNIFSPFYISIVFLILYLFSIFIFKIVDCIYFMRLQSWRLQTFVRITKLIIWNTCLLIIISKYESLFKNKENFNYIIECLKIKVKESDIISKVESEFKRSALIDLFSNYHLFLEKIYDLYFKSIIYIVFKFCVLNVLKFYLVVEIFIFMLFRHKYTIPYLTVYVGMILLAFPEYNFFIIDNSDIKIDNKKNNNSNNIDQTILDFVSFCYSLVFILNGYLFLYLYKLRISIWKKYYTKKAKIPIAFFIVFIVGLFLLIEFFLKLIKLKGNLSKF